MGRMTYAVYGCDGAAGSHHAHYSRRPSITHKVLQSEQPSYSHSLLNVQLLETTELGLRKVKKEGVAVIKFGVNERGCDGACSEKVGPIDQVKFFHLTHTLLSFTVVSFTPTFMLFDL